MHAYMLIALRPKQTFIHSFIVANSRPIICHKAAA